MLTFLKFRLRINGENQDETPRERVQAAIIKALLQALVAQGVSVSEIIEKSKVNEAMLSVQSRVLEEAQEANQSLAETVLELRETLDTSEKVNDAFLAVLRHQLLLTGDVDEAIEKINQYLEG